MKTPSKTTRCERRITTISDVEAIELSVYDDLVPATSVLDLFRATAALHGDRRAFTLMGSADPRDVEISLTHRAMLASILQAANLFASLGVTAGDVVALITKTYGHVPSLIWGAETAGIASCLNPLLASDTLAELLRKTQAKVVVCPGPGLDPTLWSKVSELIDKVPSVRVVLVIGGGAPADGRFVDMEPALAAQPADQWLAPRAITRDTVAALFHTGGTTGVPKLVPQTHGHQIHAAWSMAQSLGTTEQDVTLNGLPLFHVGGLIAWGLAPMAAGAEVIAVTPVGYRDPDAVKNIWGIVEHFRVTLFGAVPTTIGTMADVPLDGHDVSTLRLTLTGGAGISAAVADRFERRFGVPLIEQYGMTEAATAIACTPVHGDRRRGCVGLRHPFSQIRIVQSTDATPLVDCAPGAPGALICKGRQVVTHYVDPQHSDGAFTSDGWLITGDVGFLTKDQQLVLTGRQKDLIIRGGHNIDPASIEDVANAHPDVAASGAVGMPDAYAGEVPVVFIVPRPGVSIDLAALKAYIDRGVPEPPARPRHVFVVRALPLTAVGKIYKPALREQAVVEKLWIEVRKADAKVEIVAIRPQEEGAEGRSFQVDLVRQSATLAPTLVELRLTEALRDLTVNATIRWH